MPETRFLIATDLDGTVIPPEWNAPRLEALERFRRFVESRDDIHLAYATGRHFDLTLEGIRTHRLPIARTLLCDVGTRMYRRSGSDFVEDESYAERLERMLGGSLAGEVRGLLEGISGLRSQEEEKQGRFKISFYCEAGMAESVVRDQVRRRLGDLTDRLSVVFSVDPLDGRGLLDLLPGGVSKATGLEHLRSDLGLDPSRVVYAGDSGNDTSALLGGVNGILVGNASEMLREHLRGESAKGATRHRIHFARAHYIEGVLEGCERFGVLQ